MSLTEKQKQSLHKLGYEYLPSRYCWAKPGENIAIHQSSKKDFYIHVTKKPYNRGEEFTAEGVCFRYFKTIEVLAKFLDSIKNLQVG